MSTNCCGTSPTEPSCSVAPEARVCPTQYCHEALISLPEKFRQRLIGVEQGSKCMSVFERSKQGFVCSDASGQFITNQPEFSGPSLVRYLYDENNRPILKVGGGYMEDVPPAADAMIVTDACGRAWRWRGPTGARSQVAWDGCGLVMEPHPDYKELADYPSVNGGESCSYREAVLIDSGGGTFRLGYRAVSSRLPGEIITWMGREELIPEQWLRCDGSYYSIDLYPDLFANLGYTHGRLDDTFRVPDLRGQFLRGVDGGSGYDPNASTRTPAVGGANAGDLVGSQQQDAFQNHEHLFTMAEEFSDVTGTNAGIRTDTATGVGIVATVGSPTAGSFGTIRTSTETRPKNTSVIYLIYSGCRMD